MKSLIFCICALPSVLLGQSYLLKDVSLADVEKQRIYQTSVRIDDDEIAAIGKYSKIRQEGDSTINGNGKFLLPGLMDTHVHFFQSGGLYTRPDALDLRYVKSYEEEFQFAKDNAQDYLDRYLRMGITTVIDVGGPLWNFQVRDVIAASQVNPNVLVTGPLFSIVSREQLDVGDPPIVKVSSKTTIDSLFEVQLKYKPDFIKVWYIAGSRYPAKDSFPLVKYLGELCEEKGLPLAVHATQLETAKLAVEAGASILVHSVDDAVIDKGFMKSLLEKNVTYIPTLTVSKGYFRTFTGQYNHQNQDVVWANPDAYGTMMDLQHLDTARWPRRLKQMFGQDISGNFNVKDSIMAINLKMLIDANVTVATGTDAGNIGTFHASSYLAEIRAMKQAGLSHWEIIAASTINAARGFNLDNKLGSIKVGKTADLIILKDNPLEDLAALNDPSLVIKSGKILEASSIVQPTPTQLAQMQLNAYNARDLDAFVSIYSHDVEVYDFNGELRMKGQEQFKKRYENLFNTVPNLHCELINRISIGNQVIDQESVRVNDRLISAVAIYTIKDGLISRVDFMRE